MPLAPRNRRLLLLAAALGLALFGGYAGFELWRLPEVASLATKNPTETVLMRQRAEDAKRTGKKQRRSQSWVQLSELPSHAVWAVLISEDAAFYQHSGVDFDELRDALSDAWEEVELGRGASTITQQLAKNLFLSGDRSLLRKLKELLLARRLERALSKKRILTLYLNVIEWGDGVYGMDAGAREHFGLPAAQLSVSQAAMLASMLPAPKRWTPASRSPALRTRSLRLVDKLESLGRITAVQAAEARVEIESVLGPVGEDP